MKNLNLKRTTVPGVVSLLFLLSLTLIYEACNPKEPVKTPEEQQDMLTEPFPEKQKQIEQTINDIFNAGKLKDFQKLESFHLNSSKFTKFDDAEPLTRQDVAQAAQSEKNAFSAVEDLNMSIQDLKVDVFDRIAVATFILDYSFKLEGQELAAKARSTLVFVEDNNKEWKIAHEHFSGFKSNF